MPWEGRKSVRADLRATMLALGRGSEEKARGVSGACRLSNTHTHTHTPTSVVRVQLMWRDRRRGLHSPVFTPMTLWSNLGLRPGFHIPTNTHTQDKSRRALVHTHTRKKDNSQMHTHCSHSCSNNEGLFSFFFKKKTTPLCSCPFPFSPSPPHN